jgi:hypothetical protein
VETLASGMLNRVDFLARQREILEQVFGKDWFLHANKKDKQHPAYKRWELCQTLIDQGGHIRRDQLSEMGRIALDVYYFIQLTEGNLDQLMLGLFDVIGDQNVRTYIRSRIKDPGFYEDIMVQLYIAAWHKARGHSVALVEKAGWPDVRVNMEIPNIPMLIECKHLRSALEISKKNLERLTLKANSQIKKGKKDLGHTHCYGVLVLDISSIVPDASADVEDIPPQVQEVVSIMRRALSGNKNTSIHIAIIVWDAHKIVQVSSPPSLHYVCSRRTIRIWHTNGTPIFPEDIPLHILRTFDNFIQSYLLADYNFEVVLDRKASTDHA